MSDPLNTVLAFVEGRITPADFYGRLCCDSALEALLIAPGTPPPAYVGAGTFFHYLLELDFDDPGDVLNGVGICAFLLDARGISYVASLAASSLVDALARAQPKWLDVDSGYLATQLLPHADGRTGRVLVEWLREQLLQRFRFVSKPPKWIQSPAWPIVAGVPLVFLGQLSVRDYFHDQGAVFVFHDPATGTCVTVVQTM